MIHHKRRAFPDRSGAHPERIFGILIQITREARGFENSDANEGCRGHLFFFFWELIFRKPVTLKAREMAQQVGLFLLIGLMVLAFYNDIMRYLIKE